MRPPQMGDLKGKLVDEMVPGSRLVVCRFPLPDMVPDKTVGTGIDSVWIYNLDRSEASPGYVPPGAPQH